MEIFYYNRLRKNKEKNISNEFNNSFPFKHYITIGNKLNYNSFINKSDIYHNENYSYLNKSNNLTKIQKNQNPKRTRCNNHSLYDSNKQQIINIENTDNYVRFKSNNNISKEKKIKLSNNSIYNSSTTNNKNNNNNCLRSYSFQKNFFNNYITNINYNINIQNYTNKKKENNSLTNKINHIKNESIQNCPYISNLRKNYNFTEIKDTKKTKKEEEKIKRNIRENNKIKDDKKKNRISSIIKTQLLKIEKNLNNKKKSNKNIFNKINLPIKLNIEEFNKEKLSRIKRIIEHSSTNFNYCKKEQKENNNLNDLKGKKYIFKKKKIDIIKKEENKEGNNIRKKLSDNLLIKSTIKKPKKEKNFNLTTNNKSYLTKKSVNFFIDKGLKNNEINNNNDDDTISLSYSKEQNISFISKKMNIIPSFSIEKFNIWYNIHNKNLVINNKNKIKNILLNNESDDDEYFLLTKEIFLLKRGLAKKNELNYELRKKIKEMRMQKVYTLNLLGNKKIYKKKTSNYKNTKF